MFLTRVRMHVQYPGRARGLCLQGILVMVKQGDTAVIDTKNILLNTFFFSISRSVKLIHILQYGILYFFIWKYLTVFISYILFQIHTVGILVMVKQGDTAVIDTKNILLNTFFFSISRSVKLIHILQYGILYFFIWKYLTVFISYILFQIHTVGDHK